MLLFRSQLFSLRVKLLVAFFIGVAVLGGTLFTVRQAMAESEIFFNFYYDGESPNAYGEGVQNNGEWQYIYDFEVSSSEANIVSVEYEIDSNGRVDLAPYSTSGDFDSWSETVVFTLDQRNYADFNSHNITFYVTTDAAEESSHVLPLEPYPDVSPPVIWSSDHPSGAVQSTMIPFSIEVSDDFLEDVTIDIDGDIFDPGPYSSNYDHENYQFDLSNTYYGSVDIYDGGEHTLTVSATDKYGNTNSEGYTFYYEEEEEYPEEFDQPSFTFTDDTTGMTGKPVEYAGYVDDASPIDSLYYTVDGSGSYYIDVDVDNSTDTHKEFTLSLNDISDGEHTLVFYAVDRWGNVATAEYNVTVDSTAPTCSASFYNLPSPHYSRELSYADITCTDNVGITSAAYEIYHVVHGTLQTYNDNPVDAQDGSFGGTSETFDFTVDLSSEGAVDGVNLIQFRVWDEAGNYSHDYDPVTIDVEDNTAPIVNLDEVTPDPLTDKTPTITGSCRDQTERETNTNIHLLEYKIDAGSYQSVTLLNGGTYDDSLIESYSVDLPELSNGSHTVTVRCTDGASRTATASDTFTIADPTDPEPGEFTYTENFDSTENQDIPSSNNVVWGDGKLRLKEDISITRNLVSSTNLCPKYGECRGLWRPWKDPQDPNIIWYAMDGNIFTYNTQTQVVTPFDYSTTYGLSTFSSEMTGFALGMYNGKKYLLMSDIYALYVINITDGVGIKDFDYHDVGSIFPDFARNRFGLYMLTDSPDSGDSNLAYLNLNDMMDGDDDVLTRVPYSRFSSDGLVGLLFDPETNAVYAGPYSTTRLYKFNDQNTPDNVGDDVVTYYDDAAYNTVFSGMTLDPDGRLIFGTANNSNGRVFVVEDDGGTPFDTSDDNVIQLARPLQMGYRNIYGIEYIEGQNGVGDQLLINTEANIPVYLNFNNTYDNPYDDTFIEFDTQANTRPGGSWAIMDGYNTMYVVSRTQGFYKVDLNRGWVDMGQAVAIPTRPPEQLVVDNFVAEANVAGAISYAPGDDSSFLASLSNALVPQVYAAPEDGVHYYVSTDGGVTWTEVTLGQLQQLQQTDYRVKFKIELEEVDGATPVLSSYSLAYAGYPDETQPVTTVGLEVNPSTNSTTDNGSFNLNVEAVDTLGYPTPSYSGNVTLTLIDTSTGNPTTGLSVNSVNLTNGTGSVSGVQINKTGTFKIRATDGSFTQDSGNITVTSGASIPSPSLGFSASSYKIKKGESVTLHWASSNLTSFVLNPGNNQLSASTGDFIVHPGETTEYTITGSGPYGSAVASLTVTVEGELSSNNPGSSPSPTPGTTGTPSPTASPAPGTTLLENAPGEDDVTTPDAASFDSTFSADQTIVRGQKAEISWDIPGADEVVIDYPERRIVSSKGSFEFFPTDTTVITITVRKGDEVIQKKITITVLDAPVQVQEFARSIQDKLPWTTPIISTVIQSAKSLPIIGLGVSAALSAGVISLLALTIASQVGFFAVLNAKTITNILAAAGLLPAKQRKGFIHQTRNGVPVPFATITVYEGLKQQGSTFVTLVSDMYGVYLEPYLPKGKYNFYAAHSTHGFPTKAERPSHLSFKDFYKGEELTVTSNKEKPAVLIPMDPLAAGQVKNLWRYKLLLGLNQTLHTFSWAIYPLSLLSVVALWLAPSIFNGVIVVVYAVILLPKLLALFKRPTMSGRVLTEGDRRPIAHATLTLTTNDGNLVAVSKSDEKGKFEFYAPKGQYVLNVVSSNMRWNDIKAGTNYTITTGSSKAQNLTLTMSKITNPFGGF